MRLVETHGMQKRQTNRLESIVLQFQRSISSDTPFPPILSAHNFSALAVQNSVATSGDVELMEDND